ncbi:hypothetical protein SRHO_G00177560 [Serrasalmus rhombeus]
MWREGQKPEPGATKDRLKVRYGEHQVNVHGVQEKKLVGYLINPMHHCKRTHISHSKLPGPLFQWQVLSGELNLLPWVKGETCVLFGQPPSFATLQLSAAQCEPSTKAADTVHSLGLQDFYFVLLHCNIGEGLARIKHLDWIWPETCGLVTRNPVVQETGWRATAQRTSF